MSVFELMRLLLLKMGVIEDELTDIIPIIGEDEDDIATRPVDLSNQDDVQHIIIACQRLQMGESIGFYLCRNSSIGDIGKISYIL